MTRTGAMVNPSLRNYRIPAFADMPPSEVFFADTYDRIGPLGAKSQGECAINPVAPAIANALANATGVRFAHLPFTPDRIFGELLGAAMTELSQTSAAPVTVVTQTRVREGGQRRSPAGKARSARRSPRFPASSSNSVMPPRPPVQVDWVILQRFASAEAASAWLRSDQRTAAFGSVPSRCWSGRTTCIWCGTMPAGVLPAPVSAVISTRVKPGQEAGYRAWEQRIAAAQARFAGLPGLSVRTAHSGRAG